MLDRREFEPVFFAPFVSSVMTVEPAWIDYNGHLNMAYYNVLFDRAVDEVFELLGARYARAARATEGRMDPVPGCRELVIELDDLWAELSRLGPSNE